MEALVRSLEIEKQGYEEDIHHWQSLLIIYSKKLKHERDSWRTEGYTMHDNLTSRAAVFAKLWALKSVIAAFEAEKEEWKNKAMRMRENIRTILTLRKESKIKRRRSLDEVKTRESPSKGKNGAKGLRGSKGKNGKNGVKGSNRGYELNDVYTVNGVNGIHGHNGFHNRRSLSPTFPSPSRGLSPLPAKGQYAKTVESLKLGILDNQRKLKRIHSLFDMLNQRIRRERQAWCNEHTNNLRDRACLSKLLTVQTEIVRLRAEKEQWRLEAQHLSGIYVAQHLPNSSDVQKDVPTFGDRLGLGEEMTL